MVSIPFKREGLSEPSIYLSCASVALSLCFNSLQTGRSFRTLNCFQLGGFGNVSIPFKREGLSERI